MIYFISVAFLVVAFLVVAFIVVVGPGAGDGGCGCVCGIARFAWGSRWGCWQWLGVLQGGGGWCVCALRFACQRADALNPSSNYEKAYRTLAALSPRWVYAVSCWLCNEMI